MKRFLSYLVMLVVILTVVGTSWAGIVKGTLEKIDEKGSFYFVVDKKGKSHKIHFDNTTKKTGDVKAGAHVEVDEKKGHAKSIKVEEEKK